MVELARAHSEARRVAERVEDDLPRLLDDLERWVSIDTPASAISSCDQLAEDLAATLVGYGLQAELVDAGETQGRYVHATLKGAGTSRVALLGHHDTVFPAGTASARPMACTDGRLLGPGVADMKGGLAVGAHVARALALGPRPFGTLEFVSASDEESRPRVLQTIERLDGFDAVLCLECGRADGSVVSARKGARWFRVSAAGRAAHAGVDPGAGRNAVAALCREAVRLRQLNRARDGMTLEVTEFAADAGINTVPAHASITVDLRAQTSTDLEWAMSEARSWGDHEGIVISEEDLGGPPPLKRTSAIATLASAATELGRSLGHVFGETTTGGVSDASWTAWHGIPTLDGLGPVGALDHTPEEYIEAASLAPRAGVVGGLVAAVSAGLLDSSR